MEQSEIRWVQRKDWIITTALLDQNMFIVKNTVTDEIQVHSYPPDLLLVGCWPCNMFINTLGQLIANLPHGFEQVPVKDKRYFIIARKSDMQLTMAGITVDPVVFVGDPGILDMFAKHMVKKILDTPTLLVVWFKGTNGFIAKKL